MRRNTRIALASVLVLPAGFLIGGAGTAHAVGQTTLANGVLTLTAAPGRVNQITVQLESARLIITDLGDTLSAPNTPVCTAPRPNQVMCLASAIHHIRVVAGDLDDRVEIAQTARVTTTLLGGPGNDLLIAGSHDDVIDGGDGDDRLNGQAGNDTIFGAEGNDLMVGRQGNDLLDGGAGDDTLSGGPGPALSPNGADTDIHQGGPGADLASYLGRFDGIIADNDGIPDDGAPAGDGSPIERDNIRADVESIQGTNGDDRLSTTSRGNEFVANSLIGDGGIDTLDTTDGGPRDVVDGGGDNDPDNCLIDPIDTARRCP